MISLSWPRAALCLLAGVLLVASFAPFEYYLLAFFCVAVLFYCCHDLSPKGSFLAGLAFGYGVYGAGVSWVYVSLSTYGDMPFWMGSIAVLGFAGLLAFLLRSAAGVRRNFSPATD